jgi:hypothetical protein
VLDKHRKTSSQFIAPVPIVPAGAKCKCIPRD